MVVDAAGREKMFAVEGRSGAPVERWPWLWRRRRGWWFDETTVGVR